MRLNEEGNMQDVIIIGGGASGLLAGINSYNKHLTMDMEIRLPKWQPYSPVYPCNIF